MIGFQIRGKRRNYLEKKVVQQLQQDSDKVVALEETEIALRDHNRKSCMLNISYTVEDQNFESFMLDISPAGAFIETGEPFTAGQQIELSFSLPNNPKQLKIIGGILWKGMLGIGVKFDDIADDHADLIKAFMEVEER